MTDSKLAVSMAASWAWGASLVVGMATLLDRGWWPWAVWAGLNSACLLLFSWGYGRRLVREVRRWRWFLVAVQVFAVVMNLQAIYQILGATLNAGIVAVALGSMVLLLIDRFGFRGSVLSDQVQFACMIIIPVALVYLNPTMIHVPSQEILWADMGWALWVGLGLVAGPFLDEQQYQRMAVAKDPRFVGGMASFLFACYMGLVACVALTVDRGVGVNLALLFTLTLAVDSSTLDSAVAALQNLMGKKGAFLTVAAAIAAWPMVAAWGAVTIQTVYSSLRLVVFVVVLTQIARRWGRERARGSSREVRAVRR